ncbi:hypothetical protein V6N13_065525 [Hibiscus sabdariffa]
MIKTKRGRGHPKTKQTDADRLVNGSLSDSDFLNRKGVILKEAEETVQFGKLIRAATNDQREFWQQIVSIILPKNIAWCVGGDFDMVCREEERRGCAFSSRGISEFCDFVEKAALCDISMQGKRFTWFGSGNKRSKLDRFLVSNDWFQRFDSLVVVNLPRELSDHSPILLVSDVNDSGPKPFRFFNAWLQNPQHVRDMEKAWLGFRKEGAYDSLVYKLRDMKMVLKE